MTGGPAPTAVLKLGGGNVLAAWCALAFLDAVAPGFGPRLLGACREPAFTVMKDLGDGPALKDLLRGRDPVAAAAAVAAHADALGRLGAATRGRLADWERVVRHVGGPTSLLEPSPPAPMLADAWAGVAAALPGLGVPVPAAAASDVEALALLWRRPAEALAFSPGDVCPDNNRVSAAGVRLFDVDFCSFRPPALDAAYYRRPHLPTCNAPGEVPDAVLAAAAAAHGRHVPVEDRDVHAARAAWTVLNAGWLLEGALAADRRLGTVTYRRMLLWRLARTADASRERGELTALAGVLGDAASALAGRWGLDPAGAVPVYPAFRSA